MPLSVVIITKNEAHIIDKTLQSLQAVTDDIIIVDSGSTDDTLAICKKFKATIIETGWEGYGSNKNKGNAAAKHDWILSLDADEVLDDELQHSLQKLSLSDEKVVYNIKFKTFFCNKWIRHGEWSGDEHIRLFNRKTIQWSTAAVHENLNIPLNTKVVTLQGFIQHYTVTSLEEYFNKTVTYARLNAEKYFQQGKKANFFQLWLSPIFSVTKNYFFKLGFLDGWEGYLIAKTNAWYTFLKYAHLKKLNENEHP